MKRWLAAALGLLAFAGCASVGNTGSSRGWLLLVPPLTATGAPEADKPLSKCQTIGNFTSQADCNAWMTRQQFAAHAQFGPITNAQGYYEGQAVQILNGQCLWTGDPRMKGD